MIVSILVYEYVTLILLACCVTHPPTTYFCHLLCVHKDYTHRDNNACFIQTYFYNCMHVAVALTPMMAVTSTTTTTVTVTPTLIAESQSLTPGSDSQLILVLAIALPVVLAAVIIIITAVAVGYVMLDRRAKR